MGAVHSRRPPHAMEHTIQASCVRWFRYAYPSSIIFAIPNGGARDKVTGARLKEEGVLAGIPDLMIAEPSGIWHGMFVEMKNGKVGVVSDAQKERMAGLTEAGYLCVVCRDFPEFEKAVSAYMSGRGR